MKVAKQDLRCAIRLPKELKDKFEAKALANGQSMSERFRMLAEKDVAKK